MTELNLAYEKMDEYDTSPPQPQLQAPQLKQEERQDRIQQQMLQMQQQEQPVYYQQPQQQHQRRYPEYSFWDRMVMSKREVFKLFILSIVIVLGISLEKLGFHYITSYISSNDLTTFQEFMVRLSLPIIVFLFLWIIKSL